MSATIRRAPARWRRIDERVGYRRQWHWELWRGPRLLASVRQCAGGFYWTAHVGPVRNSLHDGGEPIGDLADAKAAAKAYAMEHEVSP